VTGERIYRQTQIAWPTMVPVVVMAAGIILTFLWNEFAAGLWIFVAVTASVLLLFATLTVRVTSDGLVAAFGVGLVRKTFAFAEVVSFAPVRNPWVYGWGIHRFRDGVLYNASGLSAIEFRMSDGRYVRIGTAEPEALAAAVQQATGAAATAHESSSGSWFGARGAVGIIVGVFALALSGWTLYTGFQPPAVTIAESGFSVSNGFYWNTVRFDTIADLTIESELPRIRGKSNGFSARNTLRGTFSLDGWGASRLYINRDAPPFVVVTTYGGRVIVNFRDPERTRQLYVDLWTHLARSPR
jgi:hypothetical protein